VKKPRYFFASFVSVLHQPTSIRRTVVNTKF
jgi:hypothetical protein